MFIIFTVFVAALIMLILFLIIERVVILKENDKLIDENAKYKANLALTCKEYKKLHKAYTGANERCLKIMIKDTEEQLKLLDGVMVGSVDYYRRDSLRATKKYLQERLNDEQTKRN